MQNVMGNPKSRNDGTVEWRNDRTAERRNGGTAERRKISPNPKRRNRGKCPETLKDGITENTPKS